MHLIGIHLLAGMRLIGMHLVGENIIVVGCEEFRFSKFGKRPFFVTIPHRNLTFLRRAHPAPGPGEKLTLG